MKTKVKKLSNSDGSEKLKKSPIQKKKGVKELMKKNTKKVTEKKVNLTEKPISAESSTKIVEKKRNFIKEPKFNPGKETKTVSPDEKKKKKNRRHRKNKATGLKTMTKLFKKKVRTLEAAEKLAEKKLDNLKELRAKRKNKLFVACKKKVTGEAQIKALHPSIKSVIFPRKKNSKYCWISFETPKKALEAYETLKNEKEYNIQKPKTNINNIDLKAKAKQLLEKSQKKLKKKAVAASWT